MAGRTLYDRVRAVYSLGDEDDGHHEDDGFMAGPPRNRPDDMDLLVFDDDDGGANLGGVHRWETDDAPSVGAVGREASPDARLGGGPTPAIHVNSIRVPFDPEEQSDDEIVITSVYERQNNKKSVSGNGGGDNSSSSSNNQGGKGHQRSEKAGPLAAASSGSASESGSPNGRTLNPRTGSAGQGKALSATASPFQPRGKALSATASPFQPRPSHTPAATVTPLLPAIAARSEETARSRPQHGAVYPGHHARFCPWDMVTNYHAWFVGKQNGERIRPYFETDTLVRCQAWDFCYVWHPARDKKDKYALLVPVEQFLQLLDRLNRTLAIQLTVPPGANGNKFRVRFGQQGTPIPRFLGHARDAKGLAALVKSMPPLHPDDAVYELTHLRNPTRELYVQKVNSLFYKYEKSDRKKNKSEKAQKRRVHDRKQWGKQLKRVQRYMGLRGKAGLGSIQRPQALDLDTVAPHPHEEDVVFVSMDIESYEFNHGVVTEVGFGVLDTRDLAGTPPGINGENWHALIRGRHLRIREHASMINRTFVNGNECNFNFGESEMVRFTDVSGVIRSVLQPRLPDGQCRNVILVGHSIKSDISLVKNVGFYIDDHMFLEIVDTQDFHQHFRKLSQQMGLRGVLSDLEIESCFLHNGGNDAVYTLQAMVSLVLKKRQDSLRRQTERCQATFKPDPEAIQQGWETGGEMSDGGLPNEATAFDDAEASAEEQGARPAGPSPAAAPRMGMLRFAETGDTEDLISL